MDSNFGEMLETSPESRRRYYELLRALSPEQRARKVVGLCSLTRRLSVAGIRQQHPEADDDEIRWRLAARLFGDSIAERVFARPASER